MRLEFTGSLANALQAGSVGQEQIPVGCSVWLRRIDEEPMRSPLPTFLMPPRPIIKVNLGSLRVSAGAQVPLPATIRTRGAFGGHVNPVGAPNARPRGPSTPPLVPYGSLNPP